MNTKQRGFVFSATQKKFKKKKFQFYRKVIIEKKIFVKYQEISKDQTLIFHHNWNK